MLCEVSLDSHSEHMEGLGTKEKAQSEHWVCAWGAWRIMNRTGLGSLTEVGC